MHSFTNTIVDQSSPDTNTDTCDLTHDDLDTLNQIMSEINNLNNQTPLVTETQLSRISSINEALGDYNLDDFDTFESHIQINDPMLSNNSQLNIY